jgi:hypothetical protein
MFVYTPTDDSGSQITGKVRLGSKYQNSGRQITGKILPIFLKDEETLTHILGNGRTHLQATQNQMMGCSSGIGNPFYCHFTHSFHLHYKCVTYNISSTIYRAGYLCDRKMSSRVVLKLLI